MTISECLTQKGIPGHLLSSGTTGWTLSRQACLMMGASFQQEWFSGAHQAKQNSNTGRLICVLTGASEGSLCKEHFAERGVYRDENSIGSGSAPRR